MTARSTTTNRDAWQGLPLDEWLPTYATLHRWTQIVGKTRLGLAPFENHWWHCTLYVAARGLTTSPMPYRGGVVEVEFDFLSDLLLARTSGGDVRTLRLENKSVADFYREYRAMLADARRRRPHNADAERGIRGDPLSERSRECDVRRRGCAPMVACARAG